MCTDIGPKWSVKTSPSLFTRRLSPMTVNGRPFRAGTVIFASVASQPELTAKTYVERKT